MKKLFISILLLMCVTIHVKAQPVLIPKYIYQYSNASAPPTNYLFLLDPGNGKYQNTSVSQMAVVIGNLINLTNGSFIVTNVYATNIFATTEYLSFATNLYAYITNLYSTNLFSTNIYASSNFFLTQKGGTLIVTNENTTYTTNFNTYTTNLTVEVPGGATNLNLTPNTVLGNDGNDAQYSIPNALGILTNNGSGGIGFSSIFSLTEIDAQNAYLTNTTFLNPVTLTNATIKGDQYGTNAFYIDKTGVTISNNINQVVITNGTIYSSGPITFNGGTNRSLAASQFMLTDANKGETTTLNGNTLTNLAISYNTNAIPSSGVLTFGQAYWTNMQANITLANFTLGSAFYESMVLMVTNSDSSDHKFTMPAGVRVAVANGGGNVVWCTNKTVTAIYWDHYGTLHTNCWKNDY